MVLLECGDYLLQVQGEVHALADASLRERRLEAAERQRVKVPLQEVVSQRFPSASDRLGVVFRSAASDGWRIRPNPATHRVGAPPSVTTVLTSIRTSLRGEGGQVSLLKHLAQIERSRLLDLGPGGCDRFEVTCGYAR